MKKILLFGFAISLALSVRAQTEITSPSNQEDVSKIKVEIYPNPTVQYLNVQITNNGEDKMEFHLRNIIGNEIKINPEKIGDDKYRINVESLSSGYYLLMVKDPTSKYTKTLKFLKR